MILIKLNATEKHNKASLKETHKCYNCEKIGNLAKSYQSKKRANVTQFKR